MGDTTSAFSIPRTSSSKQIHRNSTSAFSIPLSSSLKQIHRKTKPPSLNSICKPQNLEKHYPPLVDSDAFVGSFDMRIVSNRFSPQISENVMESNAEAENVHFLKSTDIIQEEFNKYHSSTIIDEYAQSSTMSGIPLNQTNNSKNTNELVSINKQEKSETKTRSRGGPVDLDDDDFFDVDKHLHDIHLMAATHLKQKQYDEALEVFTKLLKTQTKEYGEIHKKVASTWHNIGIVYSYYSTHIKKLEKNRGRKQKYDKEQCFSSNTDATTAWRENSTLAMEAFEHAVRIYKHVCSSEDPIIATSLVKLGFEQLNMNSYQVALQTFNEALQIRLNKFGENHGLVAKIRNNLAVTYLHLHDMKAAKNQLEKAVAIQRFVLTDLYNGKNCVNDNGDTKANYSPSQPPIFVESQTSDSEEKFHKQAIEIRLEVANMQSNLGCLLLNSTLGKKRNMKKNQENLSVRNGAIVDFAVENDIKSGDDNTENIRAIIENLAEAEAALSEALSVSVSSYS